MNDIKSQTEHKRIVLVSRLSIVIFLITVGYIFVDLLFKINIQPFIYVGFIVSSIIVYILNSRGNTGLAKIIGLSVFNIMIFLVASSQPFTTGIHLYLFASGAVALTIYDFDEWPKSLFFATLSMVLIIIVYLGEFNFIEKRYYSPDQARILYVFNALANGGMCIYSILLFSQINYDAEKSLRYNERLIRAQNDRLIKTNKELDRFVYSVSHDLRAPLSSISGLIQLAEKSSDLKETNEYIEMMKGRIVRLEEFIRDIIDFSRNARSEVRLEEVNLQQLINEIFQSLQFIKGAESIALENDLPTEMLIMIDKTRLHIVLSNLISNAIHYKNSHNRPCFIKVEGDYIKDQLKLKIQDNGIGIDVRHQEKIFNMFYRATENSKGSGLGLYIVKETIDMLGGKIELYSTLGKGTTFTLDLPVKMVQSQVKELDSPAFRI